MKRCLYNVIRFKTIFVYFIRVVIIAPACAPHSPQDCPAGEGCIGRNTKTSSV